MTGGDCEGWKGSWCGGECRSPSFELDIWRQAWEHACATKMEVGYWLRPEMLFIYMLFMQALLSSPLSQVP